MREDSKDRYCKKCGGDWLGEPIPEEYREHYGDSTHFSKRICWYDRDKDRTVSRVCPFCKDEVPA